MIDYDWVATKDRLPNEDDDNIYILYVVDDSGDTQFDYITTGWRWGGSWIVNNEICHNNVVAWASLPSVNQYKNKMRRIKYASRFNVGDVVKDNRYNCNYLIIKIDGEYINGLNQYLKSESIHAEDIENTGVHIDIMNLMDVIRDAGRK